nr:lysine-rich nucleolar protein 1 isoform X1 [Pogona vitticeps]XP_020658641.1 lysine-rich nucleolar protein 1 isoform X3 [Pogona vitticeps]XP_020658642.1 lysine-rich nucleolar protein 1 isoform X1 [Pogona vitticeps]
MAIKDSKKNISQEAVQKTTKVKAAAGNEMITIEDDEDDESEGFSHLQSSSKVKKKKHLEKQKYPDQKGTKRKKKKASELKNGACANLPIITESSTESESLTDSRKIPEMVKKKGDRKRSCEREGDYEVACEGLPEEQQGTNFLIKLARKRTVSASNRDDVTFITKQKKKKKARKKGRHTCPLMSHIGDTEDEFPEEISSKPKVIFQDTVFSGREKGRTSVRNCAGDIVRKKKAAFCLKSVDSQEGSNDILEEGLASTESHFNQGQYCKGRTSGCKQQQKDEMQVSEEETNVITKKQRKKKKKKKKKLEKESFALFVTSASSQKNSSSVSNENSLKPKSKKILLIVEDKMDPIPDADGEGKVTKKNKIQTKVVGNHLALLKDVREEGKKKKVKKFRVLQVHTASCCDGKIEEKKKKKKRKDRESEGFREDTEGEPRLKKAKFKKEGKEKEDEIKVVAFKKGNCDEVNIDKLRRQALQEEIDRESGKTRVIKEEKESVDHFGQWGTAAFENSERKTKFLRLLGGFKKGSSVPVQDSPAHATKPNMALDSSKEEKLHQNLEAEFEKAVHRKCHRGVGLGFQPDAQRYTRIDKYASKSIKFEG